MLLNFIKSSVQLSKCVCLQTTRRWKRLKKIKRIYNINLFTLNFISFSTKYKFYIEYIKILKIKINIVYTKIFYFAINSKFHLQLQKFFSQDKILLYNYSNDKNFFLLNELKKFKNSLDKVRKVVVYLLEKIFFCKKQKFGVLQNVLNFHKIKVVKIDNLIEHKSFKNFLNVINTRLSDDYFIYLLLNVYLNGLLKNIKIFSKVFI